MTTGGGVKAYATYRFVVKLNERAQGIFTECSGLQIEVEVEDVQEGGFNDYVHKLPGRVKYQPLVLKTGVVSKQALWEWYKDVLKGTLKRQHISVALLRPDSEASIEKARIEEWHFLEALPVKWTGPTLKADENAVAVETLEFIHRGLILPQ